MWLLVFALTYFLVKRYSLCNTFETMEENILSEMATITLAQGRILRTWSRNKEAFLSCIVNIESSKFSRLIARLGIVVKFCFLLMLSGFKSINFYLF